MSYDYGPLRTYEVTWIGRPPEIVQGHSVLFDSGGFMRIYGMFPGEHWRLTLMGLEDSIVCIRDITDQLAALEAMASEGETSE